MPKCFLRKAVLNVDEKYVHCKTITDGYSAWICEPIELKENYRAFSIAVKGKKNPHYDVEIIHKRIHSVPVPSEVHFDEVRKSIIHFPLDNKSLYGYLSDVLSYGLEHFEPSDKFGCCGKFRECSDAKECLHSENFYARACYYRKNLEANKIFYGENRNVD